MVILPERECKGPQTSLECGSRDKYATSLSINWRQVERISNFKYPEVTITLIWTCIDHGQPYSLMNLF